MTATLRAELTGATDLQEVLFCCFSAGDLSVYQLTLGATEGPRQG